MVWPEPGHSTPEELRDWGIKRAARVRLYRFYNITVGRYGEPFAMCDVHKRDYVPPDVCVMHKIADKTDWECNQCAHE